MSGLKSRRKGYRNEYLIRDYFRGLGYIANRVPSSGAAEGFKGDLKVTDKEGQTFLVEVKSRKASFKSIYTLFASGPFLRIFYKDMLIEIANDFIYFKDNNKHFYAEEANASRVINKIYNLHKLVKECDYLVIKDDHQKPLFLRFLWLKHSSSEKLYAPIPITGT